MELPAIRVRLLDPVGDCDVLLDYLVRKRAYHMPWSPLVTDAFFTARSVRERMEAYRERRGRGEEYRFVIEDPAVTGTMIGSITLTAVERGPFCNGRLGYSMDEGYTGRGIMTAAIGDVVRRAFDDLGLHRLEANIMPRNVGSRHVLERNGFMRVGFSPMYLQINGAWEDHEHFAKLATEDAQWRP